MSAVGRVLPSRARLGREGGRGHGRGPAALPVLLPWPDPGPPHPMFVGELPPDLLAAGKPEAAGGRIERGDGRLRNVIHQQVRHLVACCLIAIVHTGPQLSQS